MARSNAPREEFTGFPDPFDADDASFPVFTPPSPRDSRPTTRTSPRPKTARPASDAPRGEAPSQNARAKTARSTPPRSAPKMPRDDEFSQPRPKTARFDAANAAPARARSNSQARPQNARPARKTPISAGFVPRLRAPRSLRGVHFQISGIALLAGALVLGWNTLAPRADGLLPQFAVTGTRWLLGAGALALPLGLALAGGALVFKRQNANLRALARGAGTALLVFLAAKHLGVARGNEFLDADTVQTHGGLIGGALAWSLRRALGEVGATIALGALGICSLLLWSENTLGELGARAGTLWARWWSDLQSETSARREEKAFERENKRFQREENRRQRENDEFDDENLWDDENEDDSAILPQEIVRDLHRDTPSRARRASPFLEVESLLEAKTSSPNDFADLPNDLTDLPSELTESPSDFADSPKEKPGASKRKTNVAPVKTEAENPPIDPESFVDEPRFLAPRIEIVDAPPPVSVVDAVVSVPDLDFKGAVEGRARSEELTPQEILEAQAQISASDESEEPRAPKIEKPRRRFGDGPLMPEYFDESVRALDPPLPPDLEGAEEELQRGVIGVQETLASFKIDARVTDVKRGPVITRFEVQPGPGVRVASIANLDKDLARSLSALAVRIEAPVPGKNVVGIEVPNKKVHLVRMRDVLEQHDFLAHPSKLAFVLGKDIAGQPKWGDLTKMPHMLIAGATNSGKSVCLNSIIASILVRAAPDEVRFSLIDPKRVELTLYRGIPHLMHDVVVEPKHAVTALRRAIEEMDRRYRLFATRGVRNIASFNSKLQDGERPMPYIVIVIDELADLMMTAAAEFEKLICRLAQLARAVGIHLIVATQRPSVNVITGVIKANIPARVAFAVASQVDSRTILDAVGAERLIGMGDMLYDSNNGGKSTRIQGAYLSEEEVNRIVEVVKANYQYEDSLPADLPTFDLYSPDDDEDVGEKNFESDEKRDALYDDIVDFTKRHNEMSASLIQRKFGIGYPRAGRIVDQLERHGILGPADGPKPRKVLAKRDDLGGGDDDE